MPSPTIETALARATDELPALLPLIEAFGPMLIAREAHRAQAPGWTGPPPEIDAERYSLGTPILAGVGFQDRSAELPGLAATLLPTLARSFPALAGQFDALAESIRSGSLPAQELWAAAFGQLPAVPGVSVHALSLAAAELVRPFIERQAADLLDHARELPWRQQVCPVCGGAPNMSVLRRVQDDAEYIQAHGGRRFLRCSCCASEWTHKRVSCPSCGCEEPDELVVLRDPARPFERADACDRCKTFVLCLDSGEMVDIPHPDVAALTMLPLELKAREKGYAPMAEHVWSGLGG